jgi:hypothetical protein
VTLLAPDTKFVNRSMAVDQPFKPQVRGLRVHDTAASSTPTGITARSTASSATGAAWSPRMTARSAATCWSSGRRASLARAARGPGADLSRRSGRPRLSAAASPPARGTGPQRRVRQASRTELAASALLFGAADGGPLPGARALRGRCELGDSRCRTARDLGTSTSRGIRRLLAGRGVTLQTSSYGAPGRPGWLDISPGDQRLPVDWIVTEPRLVGPRLRGIPSGSDRFIRTDAHGRLPGAGPGVRHRRLDGLPGQAGRAGGSAG